MAWVKLAAVFVSVAFLGPTVQSQEVAPPKTNAERRAELAAMAKGKSGSFAHLQLAHRAKTWGLGKEMWQHFDASVAAPASPAVQREIDAFASSLIPDVIPEHVRQAETRARVRALVRQVRPGIGAGKRAVLVAALLAEPGADAILRHLAVREPLAEQRVAAVEALQRREAEGNAAFVQRRTVRDRDAAVRKHGAAVIREHGDARRAVRSMARGLLDDQPAIRIQTAEALGNLGHADAGPLLAAAGPFAGTPTRADGGNIGTRAHMYKTSTRSFVRDFEVEIAQAAAVANPVVGTVSEGVVLDVKVAAVVSHRVPIEQAYRAALEQLFGSDPGPNPSTWATWVASRMAAAKPDPLAR